MWKTVVLITLVVMSLSIPFSFPRAMGQTTTLSVEPEGVFGLVPGSAFAVDIVVSDVTDLYAWQFTLYYKSSVLNATSVVERNFLKTAGVSTYYLAAEFNDNYNATHGRMIVACTRTGNVTGVGGTGILATVTFKAVGYGFSVLYLDNTILVDSKSPFGDLIPHTRIDGQAYVGLLNVAVSSIDTPLVIPQGLIAYINVTGQNRGQTQATFDVTLKYNGTPIDGTQTILNLPNGTSKTLTFAWDILLLPLGVYNLTATATTIPGETDTSDNTLSLLVHLGAADLAITNVTTSKTVIGQEHPTAVSVTVANQGE
ncbi:cohesin domain-containing protein, partial [Candidatus Bathyarchaeota archaeon]|nr:cohesin domain-containing protein [Candidatus Bathyarchaeota archaeon]